VISAAHINVQELEDIVFEGAGAAVARIHLEREPGPDILRQVRACSAEILEASVIALAT